MFFQLFDSFFYISLAITFGLILLMVFHFKNRIHTLEEKNQDLSELCQMMIKELQEIKQIQHAVSQQPHQVHMSNMMYRQQSQPQSQPYVEVVSEGSTPEPRESPVYQKITVIDNELEEEDDDLSTEVIECEDDEEDIPEDDEIHEEIEAMEVDFDDESMENEEKIHFEMGSEQKNEMEEMMENMRKMDSNMYEDLATLLTEELRGSGVEGITGIQIISGGPEHSIHVNHIPNSSEYSRVEELDENIVQVTDEIHFDSDSNSKTSDHITDLEDNLKKVEIDTVETEDIHVLKMPEEEDISVITESETRVSTNKKNPYAKMTVQMLRTAVISKGLMSDPSKVKKQKLVEMLTEHEAESTQDVTL